MSGSFKRGFDPRRFTGGASYGHAPTNTTGKGWRQPLPREEWLKIRQNGKGHSRERACFEALQNGKTAAELATRFPARMIERLETLLDIACDPDHDQCIQAQRMIEAIAHTNKGDDDNNNRPDQGRVTVNVIHTPNVHVPMPGREKEERPVPPVPVNGNGAH